MRAAVMGPLLPSLGTEAAAYMQNTVGPSRAVHSAPEHHPSPEHCTPTHFGQKVFVFLFLNVFKCQLHLPVGSHSAAACFHTRPVTPCFPPAHLLLNNSNAEKLHFKMLLFYWYPSCTAIFCIVSFSAFGSFLIHGKQGQDGKIYMKYLFLPGRKHRLLTQAMLTNSPKTVKSVAPPLLQLCIFPLEPSATTCLHNQPLWKSPTLKSCSLKISRGKDLKKFWNAASV